MDNEYLENLTNDEMEPAPPDIDYSDFPTEPPEDEMEPAPPDIEYAGSSIDPAVHDFSPPEDYIAEQEQYEREQEELEAALNEILDDVTDDVSKENGETEAANILEEVFDRFSDGFRIGNLSTEDFEKIFTSGKDKADNDQEPQSKGQQATNDDQDKYSDKADSDSDMDDAKRAHIEKMEQAKERLEKNDSKFSKDSFVAIDRFKEYYHAYKAEVDIDGKAVHLSDVVNAFGKMMNSSMSETLLLKLFDKIEEKIKEWRDEKNDVENTVPDDSKPDQQDSAVDKDAVSDYIDADYADNRVEVNQENIESSEQQDVDKNTQEAKVDSDNPSDNVDKVADEGKTESPVDIGKEDSADRVVVGQENTDKDGAVDFEDPSGLIEPGSSTDEVKQDVLEVEKGEAKQNAATNDAPEDDRVESSDDRYQDIDPVEDTADFREEGKSPETDVDEGFESFIDSSEQELPIDIDIDDSATIKGNDVEDEIEDSVDIAVEQGKSEEDKDEEDSERIELSEPDERDDEDIDFFDDQSFPGFEDAIDYLNNAFQDGADFDGDKIADIQEALNNLADYYDLPVDDIADMFREGWTEAGVDVDAVVDQVLTMNETEIDPVESVPTVTFGDEEYAFDVDEGVFDVNTGDYIEPLNDPSEIQDLEAMVHDDVAQSCDKNIQDVEADYQDVEVDYPKMDPVETGEMDDADYLDGAIDTEGASQTAGAVENAAADVEESIDAEEIISAFL